MTAAEPIFSQIEAYCGEALTQAESYMPSSDEMGTDLVASIFELDVGQGLEQLAAAIVQPERDLLGELQLQAEVFAGFAELLNLPNFGAIAEAVQQSVALHPEQAVEIAQLALSEFEQSRAAVLAGDRQGGAAPSAALLRFTRLEPLPELLLPAETPTSPEISEQSAMTIAAPAYLATHDSIPPAPAPKLLPAMRRFSWQSDHLSNAPPVGLTMRVEADRLERMHNLVGELAINRSSLSLQNTQMQRVLRDLRERFARFQLQVTQRHQPEPQAVSRTWAIGGSSSFQSGSLQSGSLQSRLAQFAPAYPAALEFDALELDRYGTADANLQALLEDLLQLEESVDDLTLFTSQSNQALEQQQQQMTQLRDELVWARMLPLGEVLNRFPRILHDLSMTYQKPANLTLTGAELLIDRAILEKLYDPLLHLLRNAFDHGIESPEQRRRQAKPAQGQIEIRALHQGNQTIIELRDDGQGLNLERIRQRAQELGWFPPEQLASLTPAQMSELIFEPSFSTAAQVSELSGRGFGLDVVRSDLQAIRAQVSVAFVPGQGTTFTLALPLTLTITQMIICLVGGLPVALPADHIADLLVPQPHQLAQIQSGQLLWRDQTIPLYRFADLLQYACPLPEAIASQLLAAFPAPRDWAAPIVVLQREQQAFGLAVERIITEQELVIKPFGRALAVPDYLYGCTILGDGSAVPVVDAAALLASHRSGSSSPVSHSSPVKTVQAPKILVVDDATTLRRTLALFLEREGFRVLQAQDGQEALDQLHQAEVQLVVCDIEMPNMNGFEFLNCRRQDPQLAQIPVIILTSRSNEKHRWLALRLGAEAYFTKPYLEQELLTTLKALLASGFACD